MNSASNFNIEFGIRLKTVRKIKYPSKAAFVKKSGFALKTYENWELGKNSPSVYTLTKLARVLGVNVIWLVTGEGDMLAEAVDSEKVENLKDKMSEQESELARLKDTIVWQAEKIRGLEQAIDTDNSTLTDLEKSQALRVSRICWDVLKQDQTETKLKQSGDE